MLSCLRNNNSRPHYLCIEIGLSLFPWKINSSWELALVDDVIVLVAKLQNSDLLEMVRYSPILGVSIMQCSRGVGQLWSDLLFCSATFSFLGEKDKGWWRSISDLFSPHCPNNWLYRVSSDIRDTWHNVSPTLTVVLQHCNEGFVCERARGGVAWRIVRPTCENYTVFGRRGNF